MKYEILNDRIQIDRAIRSVDLAFDEPVANRKIYPSLLNKICDNAIFLAAYEKKYLGYIAFYANNYENKIAYITLIAVDPSNQGNGIGKELLNRSEKISIQKGFKSIRLEVKNKNNKAISFYSNNGFLKDGVAGNDSIYMIKKLS